MKQKDCPGCKQQFEAVRSSHKYCSAYCRYKDIKRNSGAPMAEHGRLCRWCGVQFFSEKEAGNNKQHCSAECTSQSARESRSRFYNNGSDRIKQQ